MRRRRCRTTLASPEDQEPLIVRHSMARLNHQKAVTTKRERWLDVILAYFFHLQQIIRGEIYVIDIGMMPGP